MSRTKKRAILYARLSIGDEELVAGAGRQLNDHLRPLADRLGYTVVAELGLKDRSASRYAVRQRRQYKEAMEMVDAGQVDAILFYDIDRLLRIPRELEDLIERVERTGLEVRTVNGDCRLDTADGRFIARILVAKAAKEVEDTSRRVRDHRRAWNKDGNAPCGDAYGWDDMETINDDEAYWVKWMVESLLRGESVHTIARQLNEKKIPRKRDKYGDCRRWDHSQVKSVLTTPRNYGLIRVEKKVIVSDAPNHKAEKLIDVKVRNGRVPGFIDREKWTQVMSTLDKRAHRENRPRRATLLAGFVHCAECGYPMLRNNSGGRRKVLACRRQINTDRCGAGPIDATILERAIVATVFEWVDGMDLAEFVNAEAQIDTDAINTRMEVLAVKEEKNNRRWLDDRLSDEAHDDAQMKIKIEREELLAQLAQASTVTVLNEYAGKQGGLAQRWDALALEVQRQIIAEALDLKHMRIVVDPYPADRPFRNFAFDPADPANVEAELARVHWQVSSP